MLNNNLLFFLLFIFSISLFGQNDSISIDSTKSKWKLFKKKEKKVTKPIFDSIVLSNGNLIVGEIKRLDKSVLVVKTKYSDSDFKIKWSEVTSLKSDRYYIIAINDGRRMDSSINSIDNKDGIVELDQGVNTVEETLANIIYLEPIGRNFLSRLTVDVDFGITITKANNLRQLTSNISGSYLAKKWKANAYFKSVLNRQDGIADVSRMDGEIGSSYYLKNDWFVQLNAIYLSNDEQKLKLRSIYKGGVGYYFIHNNRLAFGASGGIAWTNEDYTDDTENKKSAEAYIGAGLNKYDIGDFSLQSTAILYPSLTESGRFRADVNLNLKYDLPLDFYIKMSLTYNWDNQPIEGAATNDYVFTTSFGWEFN